MFGWCMWQTMHWLVGIARVNSWLERMARLVLAESSGRRLRRAAVAELRVGAGVQRVAVVGIDDVARRAARASGSRRADRWCRGTT